MLKQVRSALKGVIAWFIIVLLILAFALWGVPELRNFTQTAPLRVGETGFSQQTIVNEFNRQVAARRNQSGGSYSREQAIADGLPDLVINSLATRSVLEQEAAKMGLAMPRALVKDYIQSEEGFRNPATGEVDQFVIRSIAQNNGMSVAQLEEVLKQDLLRNQLIQAVSAGGQAPKPLVEAMLLRDVELRRVAYVTITDDLAGIPAEPTPDALKAYYDAHPETFTAPEYRTFSVVTLDEHDFREGLSAPEEDLRKLYEVNKARLYDSPEKRTLYQITFDTEAQAQAAAGALRDGKPFENVASERGLSLEAVTFTDITESDLLDPAVAKAAFAEDLAVGAVADPVKSLFGWTVVQLAGITPEETKSFEEVRADLESQLLEQDTRKRLFDAVEEIEEARDTGVGLVAAATQAGFKIDKVGPVDSLSFGPGGEIVAGVSGEALKTAFALEEGEESEAVDLADGHGYFFVQVDEVSPPALRAYEDVADEVQKLWRADERAQRIAATVNSLREQVAGGKTLEEAASAFNRTPLIVTLSRDINNETFSRAMVRDVFLADKGALVSGAAGFGDAQVLAEVREIGFARNKIGPGEEFGYAQYIGYQLDQELLDAYLTTLRAEYGVRTDPAVVAQIFSGEQ